MGDLRRTTRLLCFCLCLGQALSDVTLSFSVSQLSLEVGHYATFNISPSSQLAEDAVIDFTYQTGDTISDFTSGLLAPVPNVTILGNTSEGVPISVHALGAGAIILGVNTSSEEIDHADDTFVRIDIVHNSIVVTVSAVIGWLYFVAWSVSFYPQVIENFRRKSVVGLNFDYLGLNLTGFISYSVFNVGLYWFPEIQAQYEALHPRGQIPVQLNDVIFALHALLLTVITISQCFCFERGGQRVSRVCIVILISAWSFVLISLFVTIGKKITWLEYLYFFSFVKLGVTLIKYVPQAWMNYRRKSTVGWSIGNVLLDFTGGSLSMLQMFLLAYNNDDWGSLFGNPTKFGLGLFSVLFDLLFITQHYILYRHKQPYEGVQVNEKSPLINPVPSA
ncbi:cystinosin-like [Liolophura sinensis]|uniref:cystinosin-like n=1 Tax=Liolophura sinensis TaxID=3198878 RepID=UPI0031586576